MQEFYKSGKVFFAFALIAFGFIQLNIGDFMSAFLPVPDSLPGRMVWMYLISASFIIGGILICIRQTQKKAALWIALLLFILFIFPELVILLGNLRNPGAWTATAEELALCGGALIIASGITSLPVRANERADTLFNTGKILFALSLTVFAVQHFMYADFIATLVPYWIPGKLFFAYFIGIAFAAGSISLFTNIKTRLACILLGFMFLFWMIFLHLPRVAADTHIETEKTSMFIAFAFSGIFFTLASLYVKPAHARRN